LNGSIVWSRSNSLSCENVNSIVSNSKELENFLRFESKLDQAFSKAVAKALAALEERASLFKILGSYPRAVL